MQKICKCMHLPHEFTSIAYICQNMQKICKICKHEIYMHNMHSPLCWWQSQAQKAKVGDRSRSQASPPAAVRRGGPSPSWARCPAYGCWARGEIAVDCWELRLESWQSKAANGGGARDAWNMSNLIKPIHREKWRVDGILHETTARTTITPRYRDSAASASERQNLNMNCAFNLKLADFHVSSVSASESSRWSHGQ